MICSPASDFARSSFLRPSVAAEKVTEPTDGFLQVLSSYLRCVRASNRLTELRHRVVVEHDGEDDDRHHFGYVADGAWAVVAQLQRRTARDAKRHYRTRIEGMC